MRLAVLCSADSWYFQDLRRAAGDQHTVEAVPFSRIASSLDVVSDSDSGQLSGASPRGGMSERIFSAEHSFQEFEAVLVRTMPPGSLEQVVFRMDALHRLESMGLPVFNRARAIEISVDKYLTLAKLHSVGLTVPRTETSQTIEEAMAGFERLGGDVVLKPLFGSEGRGITRINDLAIAERTYRMLIQLGAVIYQQEFVEHEGADIRLFVLGDRVLGMRRKSQLDWRTNASRGATCEPLQVTDELTEIAVKAANATETLVAGVDLLPARDGRLLAIEVNAVPGWRALARTLELDVAALLLEFLEQRLRG